VFYQITPRYICLRLRPQAARIAEISGLPLDPMFSAAKLRWLLDAAPDATAVGTVDSWLVYALTGAHRIEVGNASRTQLLDVRTAGWSPELLDLFGIPASLLPAVTASSGDLGVIGASGGVLEGLPIRAVLGDSHAALHAHGSRAAGGAKVTYGTGSSVMGLLDGDVTDPRPPDLRPPDLRPPDLRPPDLCLTIAWNDRLAAEGNIRSSGATIAWLASFLGITPERVATLARDADSDGVHLVPAFGGLAAPWWDDSASGLITGLTLGSGPAQVARAALDSIAHQVTDVLDAMPGVERVLADGGAGANDHLMQIQADLAGVPVLRARTGNLSALGAALLAAPWPAQPIAYDEFLPSLEPDLREARRASWRAAVHQALGTAR
ncbi:FGGY-family carbohydrate kinase, partial [Actinoplanes sp. NPDC051633]|uniref:FGGY-family carbohydrate kinase n=1 Tax=Actinoplanes sp. NPDC051633 TaxID=3155670 RepID=UPI0034199C35